MRLPHAGDVDRRRLLEQPQTLRRERGEHDAAIAVRAAALDEAGAHETVETAGEAAGGELQPCRQVAHPQRQLG